jgi:hypothetical protein
MTTFRPPSDEELRKSGELEEVLTLKVEACKRHAAALIKNGVFENQAWFWAVKEIILEREADQSPTH